jgi:hypothetical protein
MSKLSAVLGAEVVRGVSTAEVSKPDPALALCVVVLRAGKRDGRFAAAVIVLRKEFGAMRAALAMRRAVQRGWLVRKQNFVHLTATGIHMAKSSVEP